jgi:hypothetical protein
MDSLGNDRPSNRIIPIGLKLQISQIYGSNKPLKTVNVPNVIKQNNSVDCMQLLSLLLFVYVNACVQILFMILIKSVNIC